MFYEDIFHAYNFLNFIIFYFSALGELGMGTIPLLLKKKAYFLSHHHHQSACMHQTSGESVFERCHHGSSIISLLPPVFGRSVKACLE